MIRHAGSYIVTLMAVIIGTVAGGLLGGFSSVFLPSNDGGIAGGGLGLVFMAAIGGGILGASFVTWGLLRACEYPAAGLTAVNIGIAWMVLVGLFFALSDQGTAVFWIIPAIACVLCGVARALALIL